jgi:hypothetical protein
LEEAGLCASTRSRPWRRQQAVEHTRIHAAGKQLVAIDQIEQRHQLAALGMDESAGSSKIARPQKGLPFTLTAASTGFFSDHSAF